MKQLDNLSSISEQHEDQGERKRGSVSVRKAEIVNTFKNNKYSTPSHSNMISKMTTERNSDATTKETFSQKNKIHSSIDRLRVKIKTKQALSLPTDNRDQSARLLHSERYSKIDLNSTPKVAVSEKINEINKNFKDGFKYNERDIEVLSQHPTIRRRIVDWGCNLDPNYLLELKKKQRQKEYWKHRVMNDFKPAVDILKKYESKIDTGFSNRLSMSEAKRVYHKQDFERSRHNRTVMGYH